MQMGFKYAFSRVENTGEREWIAPLKLLPERSVCLFLYSDTYFGLWFCVWNIDYEFLGSR